MATIEVVRGSLLDQDVEAIVNAANTSMRGGGGIDGAVHRLAGRDLVLELMRVAPHGAKTTVVIATPGFRTGFRHILHVAGPVWNGGQNDEANLLRACYTNAVATAHKLGVTSLGFCSISTGIYRYPLELAAPIAIAAVQEAVVGTSIEKVVFAMYQEPEFDAFQRALRS